MKTKKLIKKLHKNGIQLLKIVCIFFHARQKICIYMVFDNECCKNTSYEYLIRRYIAQLLDCTHTLIFIIVVCAVINICIKFVLKRKNIVNECSNTQLKIIHIQL